MADAMISWGPAHSFGVSARTRSNRTEEVQSTDSRTTCRLRFDSDSGPYTGAWFRNLRGRLVVWVGQPDRQLSARQLERSVVPGGAERLGELLGGDVAVLVFDHDSGALVCRRGPIGVTLLRFRTHGERLFVSTHPGWLASVTDSPVSADRGRLAAFLTGCGDARRNDFLEGTSRIRPGETAIWTPEDHSPEFTTYWTPGDCNTTTAEPTASRRFESALRNRTRQLLGDETASIMSGGIDSQTITALATADARRRGGSVPHVVTMAVSISDSPDEVADASSAARAWEVPNSVFDISLHGPLSDGSDDWDAWTFGPRAHPLETAVSTCLEWVSDGLGLSTVIAGYGADTVLHAIPSPEPPSGLLSHLVQRLSTSDAAEWLRRAGASLRRALGGIGPALFDGDSDRDDLPWRSPSRWTVSPRRLGVGNSERTVSDATRSWARPHQDWRWELLVTTCQRTMRRTGVEFRFPYLDSEVWSASMRLPAELRNSQEQSKGILHRIGDRLPLDVDAISRPVAAYDRLVERDFLRRSSVRKSLLRAADDLELPLDSHGLRDATARYVDYVQTGSHGSDDIAGSFPVWRAFSAIAWKRSRPDAFEPTRHEDGDEGRADA